MVAELRAPTTDLCDLGLSVDPGTVFVSLYFAQVLRGILFVFQVWPTHLQAAVRVRYRHSVERGKRSPTRTPTTQEQQQPAQGPQRFRMNSPEGGQGLPGGATAPYAHAPPPPPKAASGSMPGSPTGQQEVFSTAQMTQIAQIVSLSIVESGYG